MLARQPLCLSLLMGSLAVGQPCSNLLYDAWRDQRGVIDIAPASRLDPHDPTPYFPARDTATLERGIREAHARARYWQVRLPLKTGGEVTGRVVSWGTGTAVVQTAEGRRELSLSDVAGEQASVFRSDYEAGIPELERKRVSEIARAQGLLHATHGVSSLEILHEKLRQGALVPMDPGREQWRIGNYLELVGPDHLRRVLTRRFHLVFRLDVLDRTDYFVSPLQNFGTRTPRTVEATDKRGLAALFWEIAGGHGTSANEVVIRDNVSYDHLIAVEVGTESDRQAAIQALEAARLVPPRGSSWSDSVTVTAHHLPLSSP